MCDTCRLIGVTSAIEELTAMPDRLYAAVDVPLMRKTMSVVAEVQPERGAVPEDRPLLYWDQGVWRSVWHSNGVCHTAMCFAGWADHLTGARWADQAKESRFYGDEDFCDFVLAEPDLYPDEPLAEDEEADGLVSAVDRARTVLGLSAKVAPWLFSAANTMDDLHEIVDYICERAERVQAAL